MQDMMKNDIGNMWKNVGDMGAETWMGNLSPITGMDPKKIDFQMLGFQKNAFDTIYNAIQQTQQLVEKLTEPLMKNMKVLKKPVIKFVNPGSLKKILNDFFYEYVEQFSGDLDGNDMIPLNGISIPGNTLMLNIEMWLAPEIFKKERPSFSFLQVIKTKFAECEGLEKLNFGETYKDIAYLKDEYTCSAYEFGSNTIVKNSDCNDNFISDVEFEKMIKAFEKKTNWIIHNVYNYMNCSGAEVEIIEVDLSNNSFKLPIGGIWPTRGMAPIRDKS